MWLQLNQLFYLNNHNQKKKLIWENSQYGRPSHEATASCDSTLLSHADATEIIEGARMR